MATATTPQTQTQTQLSPGMTLMYPGGGSPHFMQEIKVEQAFMDVDSRSSHCPSVDYNFPSPRSNSTVDSIPPMQLGQNRNHLYLPDASNFPINSGCSPTRFNGGTMTPINNNNSNNNPNMMMNNNNNNNGFLSLKLNAVNNSPTQDMKQVFQQPQQYLPPPTQTEQNQYLPQAQPEQIQYPQQHQQQHNQQQQQQQQPHQQQHQAEGHQQSFSDLILSSTLMDLGPIDTNELIQGIDETLSSLGLTGGATQMNNNFANY